MLDLLLPPLLLPPLEPFEPLELLDPLELFDVVPEDHSLVSEDVDDDQLVDPLQLGYRVVLKKENDMKYVRDD